MTVTAITENYRQCVFRTGCWFSKENYVYSSEVGLILDGFVNKQNDRLGLDNVFFPSISSHTKITSLKRL